MMSGHTELMNSLKERTDFVDKNQHIFCWIPRILSTVDTLVGKDDVIIYDVDAHACVVDGVGLPLESVLLTNIMMLKV